MTKYGRMFKVIGAVSPNIINIEIIQIGEPDKRIVRGFFINKMVAGGYELPEYLSDWLTMEIIQARLAS